MIQTDSIRLELRALEALGDALILFSQQGRIVGWTGSAQAMFGYAPDEIVGQHLDLLADSEGVDHHRQSWPRRSGRGRPGNDRGPSSIWDDDARPRWAGSLVEQAAGSGRLERATTFKHKDGHNLSVVVTVTPLTNAAGQRIGGVCLVKDLGPWLRLQAPQSRQAGESVVLAAFHDITTRLARSLDLDETLSAITRAVTELIEADIGSVGLVDDTGETIRPRMSHGHLTDAFVAREHPIARGIAGRALVTGDIQRVDDYWSLPEAAKVEGSAVWEEPIRSAMVAPLRARGRTMGVIGAYRRRVEPFNDRAVFLLRMLADHASIALDNAIGYSELARARQRVEALLAGTEAIWRPLPRREMAVVVAEQACRLLTGTDCLVWLPPDGLPQHLEVMGGAGEWGRAQVGREMQVAKTELERALVERRPIEIEGASPHDPVRSARLVPLSTGQPLPDGRGALGVIGFYRVGIGGFSSDERQLMDEFGKRVSLALHRAELLEEAQHTAQRLQAAIEIAVDLAASLDPSEVIRLVLRRVAAAVEAEAAALFRIEDEDLVVEDVFDELTGPSLAGLRHPIKAQPLVEEAIAAQRPLQGGRYRLRPIPAPARPLWGSIRHTVTLPLALYNQVVAVLLLGRRTRPPFGSDDLHTLELIGNHAVLALRNARLYFQAEEAARAKSDFLNMAAHELRTPLSVISGYLSMLSDGSFGPVPALWQQPLDTLNLKAAELGRLIEDLLLASRLEAGAMAVGSTALDLRRAVKEAVSRALPRATVLGAELSQRLPREPVIVEADPDHLARILDNLINNALSYSRTQPWVRVTVTGRGAARVVVEDRGRGIPRDLQEKIFERFYRIDDPELRHQAGTGLGLYISRDLAARQNGSLRLEWSEVGKGSRFALSFPNA